MLQVEGRWLYMKEEAENISTLMYNPLAANDLYIIPS